METAETKPPHSGIKKGLYVIPTLFTAANIAMGFLAMLSAIRGYQAAAQNAELAAHYFDIGAIAIGFAILFDTLDGRVARMTRTATEIGVQFDSLADVLTFGIAPTALVYAWAIGGVFEENSGGYGLGVFLLFAYLMCGTFRLARFNLQATRPRVLIEGSPKLDKKNFVGLPIPPAAAMIASIIHFAPMPLISYGEATGQYYTYALLALVAVLGILMVSTIRYWSFKTAGTGRGNFYIVLLIAALGMVIWLYSRYALLAIAAIYVSHGLVIWLLRSVTPKPKPVENT